MKKLLLLCICITGLIANVPGQILRKVSHKNLSAKVSIVKAKELQVLASKCLHRRGIYQTDLDSAINYGRQALVMSEKLKNNDIMYESLCLIGESYFKFGNVETGKEYFNQAIKACQTNSDREQEGRLWLRLRTKLLYYQLAGPESIKYIQTAKDIATSVNDQKGLMNATVEMGYAYIKKAKLDSARIELLKAQAIVEQLPNNDNFQFYKTLGLLYRTSGEQSKALELFQKALQNIKDNHVPETSEEYGVLYSQIAILSIRHDKNESYKYFKLAIDNAKHTTWERGNAMLYNIANPYTAFIVNDKKPEEAMTLITDLLKSNPPIDDWEKGISNAVLANCYQGLEKNDLAEKSLLLAIKYLQNRPVELADAKAQLSRLYTATDQLDKAQALKKNDAITAPTNILFKSKVWDELTSYRIDSAKGDFKSALEHYRKWKQLSDSTDDVDKTRQLAEIQVKYATKEKEQAIKLLQGKEQKDSLERNIKTAELQKANLERNVQKAELQKAGLQRNIQQAELKKVSLQRNIQEAELKNAGFEHNIQQARLQKANTQRNITIVGASMLLLILMLAYNGYRNKTRSNKLLNKQKNEIDHKNLMLENLVVEKDKFLLEKESLLIDKDWLLKEVHHRVKNNLQIIISLLSTQSAYLENKTALNAINESQNRVRAISLIHQKLYTGGERSNIRIDIYIADLIRNLEDCYDTSSRALQIKKDIDPVKIDIAQAVPLGLIINEAVTNAIKYAFNKGSNNFINISLKLAGNDTITILIADNGKGLPANFDLKCADSLGMEMMKALSKQLNGHLKIGDEKGTVVKLSFQLETIVSREVGEEMSV